ncbi:hypothetical protein [Sporanaerobacter acetigenes]|uniref:hypothetical protein n=1 Tax=Sporanaerobacter acetigenes TaxID=165813 RepID=UPI0010457C90|nr:hypothetical protein [Sporanaerobacter acetigenes]
MKEIYLQQQEKYLNIIGTLKIGLTIFNMYLGNWMLFTTPTDRNLRTIKFWRKTLSHYTKNQFIEENKDLPYFGFSKVFIFNNEI